MNCSGARTSRRQWLDFTEGRLSLPERLRMEEHMSFCAACRQRRDGIQRTDERLQLAAGHTRAVHEAGDASLSRIWDGVRFRIRRALARPTEQPIGLDQLRSILASMFGPLAADGALKTAALRAEPEYRDRFASNLGSLVDVVCGDKAGHLVRHAARGIDKERVA